MKQISEDILISNFTKLKKKMIEYVGSEETEAIINTLGGEEKFARSTFANTETTGLAYDGSLVKAILSIASYGVKINGLLPERKRANIKSIVKVSLLSHIAKVILYSENDNAWEREKRGILYKYNELEGALRVGERSINIASNAGVKFTDVEFEAMRIMDKTSDDEYSKYFSTVLSLIIRQANEITNAINRQS